jgi:hypothetical protein
MLIGYARVSTADQNLDLQDPQLKTPVEDARSERNLITSQAGRASGGINTANMARGFGGGAGAIGTHTSTQVQHGAGLDPNAGGHVQRSGTSGKASRAREEVEIVFDRNKGALYALYGRALRDQPELAGKLVLEFTMRHRRITMCRVVSSELKDPGAGEKSWRACACPLQARGRRAAHRQQTDDFFPAA